jgi:hypothetical protein
MRFDTFIKKLFIFPSPESAANYLIGQGPGVACAFIKWIICHQSFLVSSEHGSDIFLNFGLGSGSIPYADVINFTIKISGCFLCIIGDVNRVGRII